MDKPLFLPIILGTTRKGRRSEHVAPFLKERMEAMGIETEVFDARDFSFSSDDYGIVTTEQDKKFQASVERADGLAIIAPEYNHGYPGVLKSMMDMLLKEYIHKAVGLVGVSSGGFGGTRVIQSMIPMVRELGLAVTYSDLNMSKMKETFSEDGKLLDEAYVGRADKFLEELVWMATALKWGRENLKKDE